MDDLSENKNRQNTITQNGYNVTSAQHVGFSSSQGMKPPVI
jgi:hypothetical protein